MGDDTIYADVCPELFDAASDLLLDKAMTARKIKDREIYDLAVKALDYYREYLAQNQPFDHTTGTYTAVNPVYKEASGASLWREPAKASWAPYNPGKPYKSKVDIVDCYGNLAGIATMPEVSCDPTKGTVLTIPAANILRMDVNYGSSGNVVRTVEYMDKAGND